ncbi:transcription factor bHLH52-like [Solanum verrucosum]|uniref:transcription factor bHLH52-like n=1 Tax=Solanum verrucosum TaxID=315347 RepID=UPI0020D0ED6F|nr:transcription factor bHLH52-like [Solanum verrucosum]
MASVSYYSASKVEPNVEEFNSEEMQTMQHLLFDFNYDVEHTFSDENQDQDCYFDPDEFILPVEMNKNSEYSVFEKQQKVLDGNLITPSTHNSCFIPDYSDFESTPKRQRFFQEDFLPNSTDNLTFTPEYSVYENTPKRQEVFQDNCQGLFNEGFVPNPQMFEDFASYLLPEIPMPVFSSNNAGVVAKKGGSNNNNEKKMSAQSIAARQRRKKISDKTQELGKLIPGGHRMNTAEMLQATFKYIKLLQAQAGLLAFMGSYQESFETSNLQKLVGSSLIQEKLYSSEHCLVPKVFLEALENNQEFQNSQVLEEIKTLIK